MSLTGHFNKSMLRHHCLALRKWTGMNLHTLPLRVFDLNLAGACCDGDGVAPAYFFFSLRREASSNWQVEILTRKQKGKNSASAITQSVEAAVILKWF